MGAPNSIRFRRNRNYQVNSTLTPFSFPNDTWFEVVHRIDQYNDLTEVFINGVSIITHPYTWQAFGNSGINQLGAIDFSLLPMGWVPILTLRQYPLLCRQCDTEIGCFGQPTTITIPVMRVIPIL